MPPVCHEGPPHVTRMMICIVLSKKHWMWRKFRPVRWQKRVTRCAGRQMCIRKISGKLVRNNVQHIHYLKNRSFHILKDVIKVKQQKLWALVTYLQINPFKSPIAEWESLLGFQIPPGKSVVQGPQVLLAETIALERAVSMLESILQFLCPCFAYFVDKEHNFPEMLTWHYPQAHWYHSGGRGREERKDVQQE